MLVSGSRPKYNWWRVVFLILVVIISLVAFCGLLLYSHYSQKFLPQTFIGSVELSNLDFNTAQTAISGLQINPQTPIVLSASDSALASSSGELELNLALQDTLIAAFNQQQQLGLDKYFRQLLNPAPIVFQPVLNYSPTAVDNFVIAFAQLYNQTGDPASISINDDEEVEVTTGQDTVEVDRGATIKLLLEELPWRTNFKAVTKVKAQSLTPAQADQIKEQVAPLLEKTIVLETDYLDNYSHSLTISDLAPLLHPLPDLKTSAYHQLFLTIAAETTRSAQEPKLVIESTAEETSSKVSEFVPPLAGLSLSGHDFTTLIESGLAELLAPTNESEGKDELILTLPLKQTAPTTSLEQTNTLGIKEEIGFGESYYAHSIAGRIHNVALTASRVNNTLVAPGEEFSFNQVLGEVSGRTGFQPGYIIQGGRSVLADGGGVCQVSTTLFRALLDAGLQITLRRPHSYRVTYYELDNDPGFDATVYSGNVDLRFINDTSHHILISMTTDSKNLYMTTRIYGTSDGRYTQVTDYKKFNQRGAPAPQYIDDPTLPVGTTRQIDWAVAGLQTSFMHTIYNSDGSERSQTEYKSNYTPWSSKFLVGTAPSN